MKTIENTTLYVCDYCKRKMQRKHAMIKHEENCNSNPDNKSACGGCIFLEEGEDEVYYEANDGYGYREWTKKVKTFSCKKLNKKLYPFKVVRKGLLDKYPETFEGQEQMPTTCEHWDYIK